MDDHEQTTMDWRRDHLASDLSDSDHGTEVTLAGWVHELRNLGGIAFIFLRDRTGMVQLTAIKKMLGKPRFKDLTSITKESVLSVKGKVQKSDQAKAGFEVLVEDFVILGPAKVPLPLGVSDEDKADIETKLDTRLDSRFLDLRKPDVAAIFRIRSTILQATRELFQKEGFIEVHTPKIVATATEGGTALFSMRYFEQDAFLNQSPQLYKQILMASGLDRVYEIGPAFRAEEHDTSRHLNEFTSIDIEMAFAQEEDVMELLEKLVAESILAVRSNNESDLQALGIDPQVPALPFPRVTYDECLDIAKGEGIEVPWGEDISMEAMHAVAKHHPDYYFITRWPTESKPFYAQPLKEEPKLCRGFDLNFAEKEVTSGAMRVSDPQLLTQRLEDGGLDPKNFTYYLQAFEYGMPPHAGWGLGAERLTMIITGQDNIRECILFPRDRKRLVP